MKSKKRRLFRQYAHEFHDKEAVSFVRIEKDFYDYDRLITLDSNGYREECTINYEQFCHWLMKKVQ